MRRLVSMALLTGLAGGLSVVGDVYLPQAAHAEAPGERRVLNARDLRNDTTQADAELARLAEAARMEAIEKLKHLCDITDGQGDTRAEMFLRLADLYYEEGRARHLQEMANYMRDYDACFNTAGCVPDSIVQDHLGSRQWYEKSVKIYRQILVAYPQYSRADDATFYLAQALSDLGEAEEANSMFGNLVRTYPDSVHAPDAYLLIGEYWFDHNEAFKALQAYQRAAAYKDFDKYTFVLYKLAWCYYNVAEYGRAIETMKQVVAISSSATGPSVKLMDEALKDLLRFFADSGSLTEAIDYLQQLGRPDLIQDALRRLATVYEDQGKFDQAITVYKHLIAENPDSPLAAADQHEIVAAWMKIGNKQETVNAIRDELRLYGKKSAWARSNAANPEVIQNAQAFLEKNLRTVAINYVLDGRKTRVGNVTDLSYALAEQCFRIYLEEFPDSAYQYDMRFSFAELLYTLRKYDDAYDQYMAVVRLDPKGKNSQFSARSAIFAAEHAVKSSPKPAPGASKVASIPLTPAETRLIAALDQFIKEYPGETTDVQTAVYRAGYLYYDHNLFKEMSNRFQIVIQMAPGSKKAMEAASLILDSFALVEDWTELKKVAKLFYDQPNLGDADFKRDVHQIYENTSLKLIEGVADQGAKADAYRAFYAEFPQSAKADFALNNASVYYQQLGRVSDELEVRQLLVNQFPGSRYYNDQVAGLGFDYESIGDFSQAAVWYEKLFATDPRHSGSAAALFSAALFRSSLGEWDQAIKDYQQFLTSYPGKPNVSGIQVEIGRIYEKQQKWTEAAKVYLGFFSRPPATATVGEVMFCRLQYGLLLPRIGQSARVTGHWQESTTYLERLQAQGVDVSEGMEAYAQILFLASEPGFEAFLKLKMEGPGDKKLPPMQADRLLFEQLRTKTAALVELERNSTRIVQTGVGPWGLAALTRLGEAYENMADSILQSWIPTYLTPEQQELYRMALQDKAWPQTERATLAYSQALQQAYRLSIYDENTAQAVRRLGVLRPEQYPGLYETVPTVRAAASTIDVVSFRTE